MKNWISCKDMMPSAEYGESKNVLTVDIFGEMRVAYWDGGNWNHPNGNRIPTIPKFPITHWMPLPNPPKREDI